MSSKIGSYYLGMVGSQEEWQQCVLFWGAPGASLINNFQGVFFTWHWHIHSIIHFFFLRMYCLTMKDTCVQTLSFLLNRLLITLNNCQLMIRREGERTSGFDTCLRRKYIRINDSRQFFFFFCEKETFIGGVYLRVHKRETESYGYSEFQHRALQQTPQRIRTGVFLFPWPSSQKLEVPTCWPYALGLAIYLCDRID